MARELNPAEFRERVRILEELTEELLKELSVVASSLKSALLREQAMHDLIDGLQLRIEKLEAAGGSYTR